MANRMDDGSAIDLANVKLSLMPSLSILIQCSKWKMTQWLACWMANRMNDGSGIYLTTVEFSQMPPMSNPIHFTNVR